MWQRCWKSVQLSEYVERRALYKVPVLAFWGSKVELCFGAPKVPSPVYTLHNEHLQAPTDKGPHMVVCIGCA